MSIICFCLVPLTRDRFCFFFRLEIVHVNGVRIPWNAYKTNLLFTVLLFLEKFKNLLTNSTIFHNAIQCLISWRMYKTDIFLNIFLQLISPLSLTYTHFACRVRSNCVSNVDQILFDGEMLVSCVQYIYVITSSCDYYDTPCLFLMRNCKAISQFSVTQSNCEHI